MIIQKFSESLCKVELSKVLCKQASLYYQIKPKVGKKSLLNNCRDLNIMFSKLYGGDTGIRQ
jgi:hypothetical protein